MLRECELLATARTARSCGKPVMPRCRGDERNVLRSAGTSEADMAQHGFDDCVDALDQRV